MAGINKLIVGEITQGNKQGKALEAELAKKLSPEAIVKKNPCEGYKK